MLDIVQSVNQYTGTLQKKNKEKPGRKKSRKK